MTEELIKRGKEEWWNNTLSSVGISPQMNYAQGYKDGYIAGATENGIQWHKVADGDLPKDTNVKRVFTTNNKYYRLYYSDGRWVYCDKGGYRFFGDVIAWCEEPIFKEQLIM